MSMLGNGAYTYEPVENWAKLPPCDRQLKSFFLVLQAGPRWGARRA
jgi:hypothetical protein